MFHTIILSMHSKFISLFTLLSICLLLFVGCKREENEPEPAEPTDLNIVTGIYLVNEICDPVGSYGNPNTWRPLPNEVGYSAACPNPATNKLTLPLETSSPVKVWFIPAEQNFDFADINFPNILADQTYDQEDLTLAAVINQRFDSVDGSLVIDVSTLTPGFYRMFTQVEQEDFLAWQNIYISAPGGSWEDLDALFGAWD